MLLILLVIFACSNANDEEGAPDVVTSPVTTDLQIRTILLRACFDCHSNQAPSLGARLAPSYLFGLDKARQALNFSRWSAYPVQRRRAELIGIAKVVDDGSMPPGDYAFFHRSAQLSAVQKQALLGWASSAPASTH